MMRKSLLLAALGWAMPMYMSDVTAAAAIAAVPVPDADHTPEQRAAALEAMGNDAGGASLAEQKQEAASVVAAAAGESAGEQGNAQAPAADASIAAGVAAQSEAAPAGEAPNVASAAAAPSLNAEGSATNAAGAGTSSPTNENSAAELPLHVRVAHHLEAIFQLTKAEVEAPVRSISTEAADLKTHIADVLHKLHNGISVSEGAVVQKLESILRLL